MSEQHPIQGVMDTAMQKIKEMVDVNTIVGDTITTPDGSVIVPISKVSFGFASGGSDYPGAAGSSSLCFAGGCGAGITIQPIAFLVTTSTGNVSLLPVAPQASIPEQLLDAVPELINKVKTAIATKKDKKAESSGEEYIG